MDSADDDTDDSNRTNSTDDSTNEAGPVAVAPRPPRVRMSGSQRREQLVDVGRALFASKGYEAVTVEEIAAAAKVSKPVVYEHFGGKEGLYAVVVDREVNLLIDLMLESLTADHPRAMLEACAVTFLTYVEDSTDGFRVLVRDSPPGMVEGSFASTIQSVAERVENILASEFSRRGYPKKWAPMYTQMLVGMVVLTGQWWVDVRKPKKEEVAAHLTNLAWNGLSGLDAKPTPNRRSKDRGSKH